MPGLPMIRHCPLPKRRPRPPVLASGRLLQLVRLRHLPRLRGRNQSARRRLGTMFLLLAAESGLHAAS